MYEKILSDLCCLSLAVSDDEILTAKNLILEKQFIMLLFFHIKHESASIIIHAFINNKLDYLNPLLYDLPDCQKFRALLVFLLNLKESHFYKQ